MIKGDCSYEGLFLSCAYDDVEGNKDLHALADILKKHNIIAGEYNGAAAVPEVFLYESRWCLDLGR